MANPSSMTEPYIQKFPALELEIRRNTSGVPSDGKYHVLFEGRILGSYSTLRKAQERYKQCIEESGWQPAPKSKVTADHLDKADGPLLRAPHR
jgi:hypothetical protein